MQWDKAIFLFLFLFYFFISNKKLVGIADKKNLYEPTLVMSDKTIRLVCAAANHTLVYKNNGDILVFGKNNNG